MLKTVTKFAALSLLAIAFPAFAQTTTYNVDPAHSSVEFSIRHMAISTVHGRFSVKSGVIAFDPANLTKSSVETTIDVTSVDTGVAARDAHLKSADFFDTAKTDTATFKSTSIKRSGDGYDVVGNLTLHGITKPVTLRLDQPSKEQIGMDKKAHRGFSATTTLHRQDFGLTWNGPLQSGDNVLGDDVKLTFEIEAGQP